MICPKCKIKLFSQKVYHSDPHTDVHEYGCSKCKSVFMSLETLDKEPIDREAEKNRVKQWRKSHGEKST